MLFATACTSGETTDTTTTTKGSATMNQTTTESKSTAKPFTFATPAASTTKSTAATTTKHPGYRKDDGWRSHPQDYKLIAITFDGPPDNATLDEYSNVMRIIDALHACGGGSALFNVPAHNLEAHGTAQIRYALDRGFELGIYPRNATQLGKLSAEEQRAVIQDGLDALKTHLNYTPKSLRPAYLSTNPETGRVCRELGLYMQIGNYYSGYQPYAEGGYFYNLEGTAADKSTDPNALLQHAHDGTFWILHPHGKGTPDALEEAIPQLYDQGFRFCTVSEMFEYKNQTPELGKSYGEVRNK
jgi:peptidoglycan/xylan/chitin deacetylase (PgdA/CDA1 family)